METSDLPGFVIQCANPTPCARKPHATGAQDVQKPSTLTCKAVLALAMLITVAGAGPGYPPSVENWVRLGLPVPAPVIFSFQLGQVQEIRTKTHHQDTENMSFPVLKQTNTLNTHIDHRPDDSERLKNVEQFQEMLEEYPGMPGIFCGDFISMHGSRTQTQVRRLLADSWEEAGQGNGFTFPADKPNRRIDYLWSSPGSVKPLKIYVPQTFASDHLPLVGAFQID